MNFAYDWSILFFLLQEFLDVLLLNLNYIYFSRYLFAR